MAHCLQQKHVFSALDRTGHRTCLSRRVTHTLSIRKLTKETLAGTLREATSQTIDWNTQQSNEQRRLQLSGRLETLSTHHTFGAREAGNRP